VIPLHTLDDEQSVIYVGSFSKSLSPVLRLGFIVAPPSLQPAIHIAKQLMDWHTNMPLQGALAEFLDTDGFARHVRRMRGIYARRSKALSRALKEHLHNEVEIVPRALGLHPLCTRPTHLGTSGRNRCARIVRQWRPCAGPLRFQSAAGSSAGAHPRLRHAR
jgi:GntR family transcriptional regulator / MocR family aminotransferase